MRLPKFIVSDRHRFVYCVVQKVACSSVKAALLPLFGMEAGRSVHETFAASPHEIRGDEFLAGLEAGRFDGHFKFAFVRNPWDRLVSCYLQKLGDGADPDNSVARRFARRGLPAPGFREFAESVCSIPDERANPHFRSQHVGMVADGGLFPDFVGRFERLADDFAVVAADIGADPSLPHLTRSPDRDRRHYRAFYDAGLAGMVGERYRRDAELFGYTF
jgi:chondroitin 4-sulfotransferase 11